MYKMTRRMNKPSEMTMQKPPQTLKVFKTYYQCFLVVQLKRNDFCKRAVA